MPGIFRPSHLVASAYDKLVSDYEDSSEIEGFIFDDETANAEATESGGDDIRAHDPSRIEDTHASHPMSTHSTIGKRSSSSQTTSNR